MRITYWQEVRMTSLVSVCAWCKLVKTPTGWFKASKALRILGIQKEVASEEMTHGICPNCAVAWGNIDKKSFEDACQREAYATA